MGAYAIAAAEDCSKRLGDYVSIDVLNAIQRTAAKPWVSKKPYDKNACLPDLNLLLLDAKRLDDHLIDSIIWWSKILGPETQRFFSLPHILHIFCTHVLNIIEDTFICVHDFLSLHPHETLAAVPFH